MSIIDQIVRGIISPEDNVALSYLATLLGDKLVFNTGVNESLLVYVSAALAPVYLGVLFAIMSYIGIGGAAKTAMDGEFLGKNWHSIGVPSFLGLCIMLLSPVPSQNGITLGQVIFVRAVVIGSNFGDFILKTAIEQNKQLNNDIAIDKSIVAKNERTMSALKDTSDRLHSYFKIYACSMQYTINGGASDAGYFVQLTSMCGVPAESVSLYQPYFRAVTVHNGEIVDKPPPKFSNTQGTEIAKEYSCMFNTINSFRTNKPSSETIKASGGVIKNDYPIRIPALDSSGGVNMSARAQIIFNPDALIGIWPQSVVNTLKCLGMPAAPEVSKSSENLNSWGHGWAMAAKLASDDLKPNVASRPSIEIKTPHPENLPNTGSDILTKVQIGKLLVDIDEIKETLDNQISNILMTSSNTANEFDITTLQNPIKIGASAVLGGGVLLSKFGSTELVTLDNGTKVTQKKIAQRFTRGMFKTMSSVPGMSFLNNTASIGRSWGTTLSLFRTYGRAAFAVVEASAAAHATASAIGDIPGAAAAGRLLSGGLRIASKVAGGILKGAGKVAKVASMAIYSIPGLAPLLTYAVILMNVIGLIPEIVMVIALLLWLVQVSAWFLLIPITTLIIAIPNTDAGHSSWRSALALALTPAVIMLFYLLSIVIYDLIIELSFYSMFSHYASNFNGSLGAAALEFVADIFTGELMFRVVAFLFLIGTGFILTATMVLKGPAWFFQSVGLRHQSASFGLEDLSSTVNTLGKKGGLIQSS